MHIVDRTPPHLLILRRCIICRSIVLDTNVDCFTVLLYNPTLNKFLSYLILLSFVIHKTTLYLNDKSVQTITWSSPLVTQTTEVYTTYVSYYTLSCLGATDQCLNHVHSLLPEFSHAFKHVHSALCLCLLHHLM